MTTTVLAIDTTGARLQLAVLAADAVTCEIDQRERGHAEVLFDRIGTLLERTGIAYADLTRIAVVTGPGSFAGLRIGLSAARGLGLALSVPVIGVPSLDAISLSAPKGADFLVLQDARRGEVYRKAFSAPGQPSDSADVLLPRDNALEDLGPNARFRAVIGSAAADAVEASGAENLELRRAETERGFADIGAVVRFAAGLDPAAYPPVPAYVRPADAKPQTRFRIARTGEMAP